jgi:NAD(P)-dependent dehydrogenase (short-subunit alcohol dehydrogenase family)
VVTGSSSGIGAASAQLLARSGYVVFGGRRDVREAGASEAVGSGKIVPLPLDVTDDESVALARAEIERCLSPDGRLAGLVNNAGTVIIGPAELLDMNDLRQQYEVNVIGAVRVTRAFLPLLRRSRGRILNMGSLTARMSFPFAGPYSSSKAALAAMSHSMRRELRPHGVHVALLEPGNIKTEIWDKHVRSVEALLKRASPEARRAYEGSLRADIAMVRRVREGGADPDIVARAVLHALETDRPRSRYSVGAEAMVVSALLKFLPSPVSDRLIARFMRLR